MKTLGFNIPETRVSKAFHMIIGPGLNNRLSIVVGFTEGDSKNSLVCLWQPFAGYSFVWRS